jgi:putative transposase
MYNRRSIRLKGYDYSKSGLYFITICCQDRVCRFGHIENGVMKLNALGMIAKEQWVILPGRFANIELDVFQVMPNHIHGNYFIKTTRSRGNPCGCPKCFGCPK